MHSDSRVYSQRLQTVVVHSENAEVWFRVVGDGREQEKKQQRDEEDPTIVCRRAQTAIQLCVAGNRENRRGRGEEGSLPVETCSEIGWPQ